MPKRNPYDSIKFILIGGPLDQTIVESENVINGEVNVAVARPTTSPEPEDLFPPESAIEIKTYRRGHRLDEFFVVERMALIPLYFEGQS